MEKLQQALQIARDQRSARSGGTAPQARATAPANELWDALKSTTLDDKDLEKSRITAAQHGNRLSAAFDTLRAKVLLTMNKNGWKRLAITSPTANCGKTTIACNMALGLTRQMDVRTILFECDLRAPSMAAQLNLQQAANLEGMLSGRNSFAEEAVRVGENVAIAAPQRAAADPASVLLSRSAQNTFNEIETAYAPDLMIFDLPPLLTNSETRAFLRNVDCALMVAQAGKSTIAQIDDCEREIAEYTNVLGVVLNQCLHDESGDDA